MNVEKTKVLWGGRLDEKPEEAAFAFQASIATDKRLIKDDIALSRAHVAMLGAQGIIPHKTADLLDSALCDIEREFNAGSLKIDVAAEDIHSFIESELTARLGDEGRRVHSGRSRNDQVVTGFRLFLKRTVPELICEIRAAVKLLLERAEEHIETIMPGYTHLQRAQPVTLGHHLVAWAAALERDSGRFFDALRRLDECPLGSGALAGSTLKLDREAVRAALGFARPCINSMDAVAARDFASELAAAAAISQTNLSRFCEDIVLWASEEFKFIELSEAWSTGSSIMPQKKNPDFAELIRGKSARVTGNLVTLLTLQKGLPYAYNKDLQEDKEALFDSLDTLSSSYKIFRGMIAGAKWNIKRMSAACNEGFLEATDAAEYLVAKGMPFRRAHEAVAGIVRDCISRGETRIACLSLEALKTHSNLFESDIFEKLSPKVCVESRSLPGGPSPSAVKIQIDELKKRINSPDAA
ncbi:MAG: argininosuccinate lyase [Spirochaetaceae bacterium]|jgi:argininosuccinate lyase|nr:argininosuccinate lyase [Spirochaetaceae bacterium]